MARILVIEDNVHILRTLCLLLEDNGHIAFGTDAFHAIAVAADLKPNLILLDLHMEPVGGEELFHTFRNDPRTKGIPVVITSAVHNASTVAKELHADGVLKKPFSMALLEEQIDTILPPQKENG